MPRVSAYRGGYLPEERRALEAALVRGELLGVATTNALELGVDIAGLDAVVVAGFPGHPGIVLAAGRPGRPRPATRRWWCWWPATTRSTPTSSTIPTPCSGRRWRRRARPTNPYVLGPAPGLRGRRASSDGGGRARVRRRGGGGGAGRAGGRRGAAPQARRLVLAVVGAPARRGGGPARGRAGARWPWSRSTRAGCSAPSRRAAAPASVHPGAVYLHRGESYVVDDLDLDSGLALVHAAAPDWRTDARSTADVAVVRVAEHRDHGAVRGVVRRGHVTTQVTAYQRADTGRGRAGDRAAGHARADLATRAVWYDLDDAALLGAGLSAARIPGALHAAEHAAIGLLPLFATCDRWDIGGMSTAVHPHTGCPTVFVHDGHPGGAGFAERGHAVLLPWLTATRAAIADCECRAGCPSCVQSPKCGNGNVPLDKAGAITRAGRRWGAARCRPGHEARGGVARLAMARPAAPPAGPSGAEPAGGGRGAVEPVGGGVRGTRRPHRRLGSDIVVADPAWCRYRRAGSSRPRDGPPGQPRSPIGLDGDGERALPALRRHCR